MNEDVFRRARELERRLWHSPKASAEGESAEREFVDFLRAHRPELEPDSHWQAYIEDLDRVRLLEPPDGADPATDVAVTHPVNRAPRGHRP